MPATNIECRVIDTETKKPISGAKLYMLYHGEDNRVQKRGPFLTDSDGHGRIDVKEETIWQSGVYAGFSGGQTRSILVEAPGYLDGGYAERLSRGLLEKKAPFFFELQPSHNYYGSVEVLAYDTQTYPPKLELGVWDGPHSGETLIVSIKPPEPNGPIPRGVYYLKKSIDDINSEAIRHADVVFDLNEILRRGLSISQREPYVPKKTDPTNQPSMTSPVSAEH